MSSDLRKFIFVPLCRLSVQWDINGQRYCVTIGQMMIYYSYRYFTSNLNCYLKLRINRTTANRSRNQQFAEEVIDGQLDANTKGSIKENGRILKDGCATIMRRAQ